VRLFCHAHSRGLSWRTLSLPPGFGRTSPTPSPPVVAQVRSPVCGQLARVPQWASIDVRRPGVLQLWHARLLHGVPARAGEVLPRRAVPPPPLTPCAPRPTSPHPLSVGWKFTIMTVCGCPGLRPRPEWQHVGVPWGGGPLAALLAHACLTLLPAWVGAGRCTAYAPPFLPLPLSPRGWHRPQQLQAIALKVQAFAAAQVKPAKVMFGLTSPMLCNSTIDSVIANVLNSAAAGIMADLKIPTVDLHQVCARVACGWGAGCWWWW
jgi:hypothetical protein